MKAALQKVASDENLLGKKSSVAAQEARIEVVHTSASSHQASTIFWERGYRMFGVSRAGLGENRGGPPPGPDVARHGPQPSEQ